MDILTVIASTILLIPVEFGIMFLVYSRWILPAINKMVSAVPELVRTSVEPFVNEKLDEVTKRLKMSSVRAERTIKQAAEALDLDGIDLDTDEGIEAAKQQLVAKSFPVDIIGDAIARVISSIEANKKASNTSKGVSIW